MSISVPKGFSVSLPIVITDGPDPAAADDTTTLTNIVSDSTGSVRLVYPDTTSGVANPVRSVRVDAIDVTGTNIHLRYTSPYDGTVRNLATLVNVFLLPNSGSAGFGSPGTPFRTPA
jgi:hypothetical protein